MTCHEGHVLLVRRFVGLIVHFLNLDIFHQLHEHEHELFNHNNNSADNYVQLNSCGC